MTQPPLSYQMKMLEEELQVQLFVRGMKRITLTEAGKVLYARAGSLLTITDITKREVIKASQAATIHIGLTPSTVSMLAENLARFAASHPEIRFDIHEGSTFNLREQLENRIVDVTTLRTPIVLNGCISRPLVRERLIAMANEQYFSAEKHAVTLAELSGEHLILSHRYRNYMLAAFEQAGLSCDIYYECEDARTALTLAEQGLGVAILPESMGRLSRKVRVCRIKDASLEKEILLAWRQECLPEEVQAFLDEIGSGGKRMETEVEPA
jgi:DNA-binding transcriptional LysR family regulator